MGERPWRTFTAWKLKARIAMKYVCTGRVHPERADVSFSRVEMKVEEGWNAVASCDESCQSGQRDLAV